MKHSTTQAYFRRLNIKTGITWASWRRNSPAMMTSSNGNIFRVIGPLCGEFTGPGEFPTQRPVTRSFDVFFDLHLNKWLSKQPRGWWFETQSWSIWRHCNANRLFGHKSSALILKKTPISPLLAHWNEHSSVTGEFLAQLVRLGYKSAKVRTESMEMGYTVYYNDVIMGTIASQITSLTIVFSIVYSDADQRKHQSFASIKTTPNLMLISWNKLHFCSLPWSHDSRIWEDIANNERSDRRARWIWRKNGLHITANFFLVVMSSNLYVSRFVVCCKFWFCSSWVPLKISFQ